MASSWFPDRERLLEHGRLHVTVYSSLDADLVTRETWARVRGLAADMDLILSEPIRDVPDPDVFGGRMITLIAGVVDACDPQPS